ncbi:hypothetical protein MMC15_007459, partial [Xylographa vitiligo]|nr:hypothetical protein [Xylographa vitiligo]
MAPANATNQTSILGHLQSKATTASQAVRKESATIINNAIYRVRKAYDNKLFAAQAQDSDRDDEMDIESFMALGLEIRDQ